MIALHLLRHAHAGDPERWSGDDAARPLSEKGRRQAERLGRFLRASEESPDLFISSPKVRARQTADIVAAAVGAPVVEDRRLAGGLTLRDVADVLLLHPDAARPCIVGHDPDVSELLGEALGTGPIPMRKGSIARLDGLSRELAPGRLVLRYLVPPEIVPDR